MSNIRINLVNHRHYWSAHLWEVSGGPRPRTVRSLGFVNVPAGEARSPAELLRRVAYELERPLLQRYQPPDGVGIGAP